MPAPGSVLLGFAAGAGIVSVALPAGVLAGLSASGYGTAWMIVIFALASLGAWVGFRALFGKPLSGAETFKNDVND